MSLAPIASDTGARLSAAHGEQLALCTRLEAIADGLPANINRSDCMVAARALGPVLNRAHSLEESIVFPAIARRWHGVANIESTIDRLKFEHLEDECFAEELHDALTAYGRGENKPHPEAFGYMLRGFFESLRRHIAFEQEVIAPLLAMASTESTLGARPVVRDRE